MTGDTNPQAECGEALLRAQVAEAYEGVPLDRHGELVREILVEVSLLAGKYRNVRRHDVPHVQEIAGLLDVLWQEVEMRQAAPRGLLDEPETASGDTGSPGTTALFRG